MSQTGEFYQRLWSGETDAENVARWEFQSELVERALDWLGDVRGRTVLEVGPGAGRESALLEAAGARVVAVNLAEAALLRTRQASGGAAWPVRADAETLPLGPATIDLVFSQTVLMHVDLERVTGEWARVLRPGGRVVLVEPLAGNPLVGLYRRWLSPYRRTEPRYLRLADLQAAAPSSLGLARHEVHYLISVAMLALPRRPRRWLRRPLNALDRWLLRLPGTGRLGWMLLAELVKTQ